MNELFRKAATNVSCLLGSPGAFIAATILVVLWAASGPYFGYSDTWQLVINTSTTIGTFLMLFVLQNSQNRDTKAINIKLDELLRAIEGARNRLVDLKDASDDDLDQLEGEFQRLARQEGQAIEGRKSLHGSKVPAAAVKGEPGSAFGKTKTSPEAPQAHRPIKDPPKDQPPRPERDPPDGDPPVEEPPEENPVSVGCRERYLERRILGRQAARSRCIPVSPRPAFLPRLQVGLIAI